MLLQLMERYSTGELGIGAGRGVAGLKERWRGGWWVWEGRQELDMGEGSREGVEMGFAVERWGAGESSKEANTQDFYFHKYHEPGEESWTRNECFVAYMLTGN